MKEEYKVQETRLSNAAGNGGIQRESEPGSNDKTFNKTPMIT